MSWVADFHIHSHFSMATSKESNPQSLGRWAGLKGISLLGTGDFTHPGWRQELKEALVPAEPGFYKLKEAPAPEIPDQPEIRFVVSGELSTIYKKNGRTRKVHHLIILPSLEVAGRISDRLADLGMNVRSDGRPILGLDSHDLFSMVLEECPEVIFIPAHIWTPHFSVYGSNSGFDDIHECYEDLTQYIHALETGLSSDPAMNWRWSALDRFTLVSNSDAHNPQNLAREANLFTAEFSYDGVKKALENKESGGFAGTIEFFPEEGKYHYDGHRNCAVAWKPEDTIAKSGICPVCGRKVTVGVLHRVSALADRPEGYRPEGGKPYQSLVPLPEVIGSALNMGRSSRKVDLAYCELLQKFGPELTILREVEIGAIAGTAGPLVAEAIRRLRAGEVEVKPGYDGEYGKVSLLREDDRQALLGQAALFEGKRSPALRRKAALSQVAAEVVGEAKSLLKVSKADAFHSGLTPEQDEVVKSTARVMTVSAGPGTGKTKTLVERIVYLIREAGVDPAEITAVTFTNRAATEIKSRLAKLLAGDRRLARLNLGTFHSLAWKILQQGPEASKMKLLDDTGSKSLIEETLREHRIPLRAREAALMLTLLKNKYMWEEGPELPQAAVELYQAYQQNLRRYRRCDFDDLIPEMVNLWEDDPDWLRPFKRQFQHLLVDEFQDLNLVQYLLVKLWAQDCRSLMVIGDPNQSIYGFRGSNSHFFNRLQQDFPETAAYQLVRNFRSAATIIKAANTLIPKAERQVDKGAESESGPKVIWCETPSEKAAARVVVDQIVQLLGGSTMISAHGPKGKKGPAPEEAFSLSEIAILYRTGWQAESLEMALTAAGLPYRVSGSQSTLEASPVREFLTFFRYLTDTGDFFWLRSALRYPRWDLNGAEVTKILRRLEADETKGSEAQLEWLISGDLSPETALKLSQFFGVAGYYREQLGRKSTEVIEDWMIRMDVGLEPELEQLKRISENYGSIEEMLRFLPLAQEADLTRRGNKSAGTEMITLSTLHAAKGLEFPVVFIVGVEEGMIPYGNEDDPEAIAEEQRLFYVGVTRAGQRLYLVNSQFKLRTGAMVPVEASRFLKMLPEDLLEKVEWNRQSKEKQLELF